MLSDLSSCRVPHRKNFNLVAHYYEKYGFLCNVYFKVVFYTGPNRSQDSTLGVVARLRSEWLRNHLIWQGKCFLSSLKHPDWFRAPPTLLLCGLQGIFSRDEVSGM